MIPGFIPGFFAGVGFSAFVFLLYAMITVGKRSRWQDEAELWREKCEAAEFEAETH